MKFYTLLTGPNFVWNRLAKILKNTKVDRAVDIASAHFFNRPMFRAKWYVGVDVSLKSLEKGIGASPDDKSLGFQSSMMNSPLIPGFADLVVSTYTMIFVPPDKRIIAVQNLIDWTAKDGSLIIELPLSTPMTEISTLLKDQFKTIELTYFHSKFSFWYERRIVSKLTRRKIMIPNVVTALMTFLLESIIPNVRYGHRNALIVARCKKSNSLLKDDLTNVERIGYRLFRDKRCPVLQILSFTNSPSEIIENLLSLISLTGYSRNELNRIFIAVENDCDLENDNALSRVVQHLTEIKATPLIDSFNNHLGKEFHTIILWRFTRGTTTYFHHEIYQMAIRQIFIVHSDKLMKNVQIAFG